MSGQWYENQKEQEDEEEEEEVPQYRNPSRRGSRQYDSRGYAVSAPVNNNGGLATASNAGHDLAHDEDNGVVPDGGWVDGPGWRMKTPAEAKRQQVIRGIQASEQVERERQEKKPIRMYSTPRKGKAVAEGGTGGGATRETPRDNRQLRVARVVSVQTKKYEREKARQEADRREKERIDAPIQRKLEKARRASEALEAKNKRECEQQRKTVRSSWEQRQVGAAEPPPDDGSYSDASTGGENQDKAYLEAEQMRAAIRNSIANVAAEEASTPPPYASHEPAVKNAAGGGGRPSGGIVAPENVICHGIRPPNEFRTGGGTTPEYWDPILDGATPSALSHEALATRAHDGPLPFGGTYADRGAGKDWDAILTEAIAVLEWDVTVEIHSSTDRDGFRRSLLALVKNALRGDKRRMRVRDTNPAFRNNIGRWACGRRLMRLAGFVMEQALLSGTESTQATGNNHPGGRGEYVWVARAPRSTSHVNALESLVRALEVEDMYGLVTAGGEGSNSPLQEDVADLVARAAGELAAGAHLSQPIEESDFTRVRRQQDLEFKEALERDRLTAASKVRAAAVGNSCSPVQPEAAPPAAPTPSNEPLSDAVDGGRSLKGVSDEGGDPAVPPPQESPSKRRAKFAESYARHLGL